MFKNYTVSLLLLCFAFYFGYGQIAFYNFQDILTPVGVDPNINVANITISDGNISYQNGTDNGGSRIGNSGLWNESNFTTTEKYLEFSITPNASYQIDFTEIRLRFGRTNAGPTRVTVQYSLNNFATAGTVILNDALISSTSTDNLDSFSITTGLPTNVTGPLTIRIWGHNASGTGNLRFNNFRVFGNVSASCTPPASPSGTITGTTPACSSSTLTYAGTDATTGSLINYWQTSPTGTSQANNATGTFNTTTSGTYYVRKYDVGADCWSQNTVSFAVVIVSGTPTITLQPTNQNRSIPNPATFSVNSSNANTYQWQVSTDSGATWNNVTGGTGATTDAYTTNTTSAPMNNNHYRCILTNTCGTTTSNAAVLTLTNSSPSNAQNLRGCFEDTSVNLLWNSPSTPPIGGYIIFAIEGTTDPIAPLNDANTYTANPNFNTAPFETPATLGKVVYKGSGTATTVTGLTEDQTYSFRIFAYNGESLTGWANGASGGSNLEGIAQGDIRNFTATSLTNQVTLNWLNPTPTSCWNEILIVANQGPVSFTPTGDGSAYTPNAVYTTPNQLVYKGLANSRAVTGLTNGLNYCFKAFIRRGTSWTEGVEVCSVPSLTYCNAAGNTSFATGITGVTFNTINNNGTSANTSYTDYTAISTSVVLGEFHNLGVTVNIDGSIEVFTRVWIDWNQDGSFNGVGEQYDLGTASNPSSTVDLNTATSNSPISIEIPTNAAIGATRMRLATKFSSYPTSCENGYSGEVEDYTINIERPPNAEINIKGNNISIPSGFSSPYGLNNTLFGSTNVGDAGPLKEFFIENIGGTTLNLTGSPRVQITGVNASDFIVTLQPAAAINSTENSEFNIQFFPTTDGTRIATVSILNSDSDENPYTFDIMGTAVCSTVLTSSIWPNEGPVNTEVTINSANNLTGATAAINGLIMPIVSTTATELVVSIPSSASSGNLIVTFSTGCSSISPFTVFDNVIEGCETSSASTIPPDLFISEVTDAATGSSSLVEIFNGTASAVNLNNYSLRIFNNGSGSPSTTANLVGTLASGATHVVSLGTTTCNLEANGLATGFPHQTFNSASGINFNNNGSDAIELFNNATSTSTDVFGVLGSNSWANGLGIGSDGVNFRRQNTAVNLPSTTFFLADWNIIDWTSCDDSDYSNFGIYDFSLGVPPSISVLDSPIFDCSNTIQLSITAAEGVTAGLGLAYQWYYLAPSATTFVVVPNNADFDNVTTNTLNLLNPIAYNGYQFYCQARENSATCYKASNAVKLEIETTIWNGNWSLPPTADKIAVLNAPYDTSVGGVQDSFRACNLIINNVPLNIANGDFVEVENNLIVNGLNGAINIEEQGSFLQINDLGVVTAAVPTNLKVNKRTAPSNNWYEYTYWSSPVFQETPENGLGNSNPNRRYQFDAQFYRDSFYQTTNNGPYFSGAGIDDIDDAAPYDWQPISTPYLTPGRGYASTQDPAVFGSTFGCPGPTCRINYIFSGLFNNGVITVPLYRNDSELGDTNWNFVGNPYPSAISADVFLATNAGVLNTSISESSPIIEGAIYLWSQNTAPSNAAIGNQNMNFSQSDYAIINGIGQTAAGGDSNIPSRYIPSGQGFFVAMDNSALATQVLPSPVSDENIQTTDIIFNNSMRVKDNNNEFFRNSTTQNTLDNKLWLNITTDNGVFSQILVGYLDNATDDYDGMLYDAPRNASTDVNSIIYTTIPNELKKFAIQGKNSNSLNLDETISLGFSTAINEATAYSIAIAQIEGVFMSENTIYIKDNLINTIHNLKESDYSFTSEAGEFNKRFEIVFTPNALSIKDNLPSNDDLIIRELSDGYVELTVNETFTITKVDILDLLGRQIYKLTGASSREVYNLSKLSKAAYIAKVTLSNGQIITKKAIKQR